jgi:hypothetical protein
MDPEPWNLLHDGTIVGLERDLADTVTVAIECTYLRVRFPDGGTRFVLALAECRELVYTPYDEPPIEELAAIADSEPAIAEAKLEDGVLRVWGGAGEFRMVYRDATLALDTRPLDIADLRAVVEAYWREWREHWKR